MFRKNTLNTAMIAAGLLSAALVAGPQLANAQAAPTITSAGTGTLAIIPYYTVRSGWETLLNVTNTTGNSLAVRVRLHESYNSRDILDFTVLLSPYDVWTAWVSNVNGAPYIRTTDRSCTVPISVRDSGAAASSIAYTGQFDDAGPDTADRMMEGYITLMVLGEAVGAPVAGTTPYLAEHVNGEPRDCATASNNFVRGAGVPTWNNVGPIPGTLGSGSPIARTHYGPITTSNPLKVNVSLVKREQGIAGGMTAVHLNGWGVGQNLVTAQQYPWFLEPTIGSHNGLWSTSGLAGVETALNASAVLNEWSNNPRLGAQTDWVVAFPTKKHHVDRYNYIQAACNPWRTAAGGGASGGGTECSVPVAPFETAFNTTGGGTSNITVTYNLYNREEIPIVITTDGTTISPAPPPEIRIDTLPYETNVLVIGNSTYGTLASALDSKATQIVDIKDQFKGFQPEFGWVNLTFTKNALPAAGMIFKARNFGDPALNFGQIMDHGYKRR